MVLSTPQRAAPPAAVPSAACGLHQCRPRSHAAKAGNSCTKPAKSPASSILFDDQLRAGARNAVCSCLLSLAVSLGCCSAAWSEMTSRDTSNNIPSSLSSVGEQEQGVAGLGKLLQGEHGKEIQACTRKCMPACLRGGEGAPGLGPISLRRELVIFKEGFRDRKYCLSECTQVCALSYNGGPGVEAPAAEARPTKR